MKNIITIIVCILFTISISAQDDSKERHGDRKDKKQKMEKRMESKKIGYITDELDLTASEAQSFWPIYNEFQKEKKALRAESKSMKSMKGEFNDAEAADLLSKVFDREQRELDLKKKYYKKLESSISKAKVAKLYILEKRFRAEVFNSIKKRMKGKEKRKK